MNAKGFSHSLAVIGIGLQAAIDVANLNSLGASLIARAVLAKSSVCFMLIDNCIDNMYKNAYPADYDSQKC